MGTVELPPLALQLRACSPSVVTQVPGFGVSAVADALGVPASFHEEVAFGVAHGASLVGRRAACLVKAHGLLKAANAVSSALSCGARGGLVLLVFEDPEGRHSDNPLEAGPLLEALGMPRLPAARLEEAFRRSEALGLPVAVVVDGRWAGGRRARIGVARRVHLLDTYDPRSGWGAAPCGFAGQARPTEDPVTCRECARTPRRARPAPLSWPRDPARHLVCPLFTQYQHAVLQARRAGRDPDEVPRPDLPPVPDLPGYRPFFEAFRATRPPFVAGDATLASLFGLPPYGCVDAITCLGGSLPLALGALAAGAPAAWAVAGDFSFLSMGPLALLEAWQRRLPLKVALFDNRQAAATGGQEVPAGALRAALGPWLERTRFVPAGTGVEEWARLQREAAEAEGLRILVAEM